MARIAEPFARQDGDSEREAPRADDLDAYPARLLRLAAMWSALVDESRELPLDRYGRQRMLEIYDRSVAALWDVLSEDLARELSSLLPRHPEGVPTQSELRVLHAQLTGWLAGLFQGLQAAAWSQHVTSQRQLEELRRARAKERERRERPGAYL
jgi:hypothetical protein